MKKYPIDDQFWYFFSLCRLLRFGVQIPELLTQRKFVSAKCHYW